MIRITKPTRLKPQDVIQHAADFFGKGGEGLTEKEHNACCISFEGSGGYVTVAVVDEDRQDRQRIVDVETREFEYQAKRFLESI